MFALGNSTAPAPRFLESRERMARVALVLSVFAFIVPLGLGALLLGHAVTRKESSEEPWPNTRYLAYAALWISYLQLALVTLTAVIGWGLFMETAKGFQGDPMVQYFFRTTDKMQTLDQQSANEAEGSAEIMLNQLIAIEDQIRRHSDDGAYACHMSQLLDTGLEGTTDAEKRAFAARFAQSPYMFGISDCNPPTGGVGAAHYNMSAVPRYPQMPAGSAIFCTDQTGSIRLLRGGTLSIDCFSRGQAVN